MSLLGPSADRWPGVVTAFRQWLDLPPGTVPVTLGEGNTPLVPLPGLVDADLELWGKFEGSNPTGSFKDRGMTVAMSAAVATGAQLAVCASTGNTAASAAAYAGRAGLPSYVVMPAGHVARGKLAQALAHGARVLEVDGNFDQALAMVRALAAAHPEVALVNSVNPYRIEGQKTAALEVVSQLGGVPDHVVLPVGNAGNITAYWRGFVAWSGQSGAPTPRLVGVQAAGAAPLVTGQPVERPETVASAIRIGRPASGPQALAAVAESGGMLLAASDEEILAAWARLARQGGLFAEPASAAALAGVVKLAAQGYFPPGSRVVVVLTGHGLKDPDAALGRLPTATRVPVDAGALAASLGLPVEVP